MTGPAQPPKELVFVADPMCSWCWGFAPAMAALRRDFCGRLKITAVAGGLRPGTDMAMDDAAKETIRHHWQQVHQSTGQPFDFDFFKRDGFIYDTEPACRAMVTMRGLDPDGVLNYLELLHKSFYAHNQDITDTSVLASLAVGLGVEAAEFTDLFLSAEAREATLQDFRIARNLGVTGFPTLVAIDHGAEPGGGNQYAYLSVGYRPYEMLEPLLEEWVAA